MTKSKVTVIGAGLAGCEGAYYLAEHNIDVTLIEMKPSKFSPAHKNKNFAELVCSNSLKAERVESAAGLLKKEMQMMGSLCIESAYKSKVPAGGALAVDRDIFSQYITDKINNHPNITVLGGEADSIPDGIVLIASGPLTSDNLSKAISKMCGEDYLSFFDAAAPIVSAESVDKDKSFVQSRYGKGDGDDYINCPMNKEEYLAFYQELINAQSAPLGEADNELKELKVYEGCMPVEVMAKRGVDTLRFGPLKPVGLTDPKTGHRPWAVVQLRKENTEGTMLNLVGFQTNLKFGEQKRVFGLIPALKNAEYFRYGVMHRNTFLNSPHLLNRDLSLKNNNKVFFAGQITGVEGYMESAMSGIIAARNILCHINNTDLVTLPVTTMSGALIDYVTNSVTKNFQPMGANFGVLPSLETRIRDKKERYTKLAERGIADLENILQSENLVKGE